MDILLTDIVEMDLLLKLCSVPILNYPLALRTREHISLSLGGECFEVDVLGQGLIRYRWGLGVMLGVYVAGCAGGHLNPAVTFVNCLYRGFPWKKWFPYACAQVSGCFCGAAIIYGNYKSAIDAYEGGPGIRTVPGYSQTATAGVFCTYPQPFMERVGMFFSEFIASAVLIFVIFALKGRPSHHVDDNDLADIIF